MFSQRDWPGARTSTAPRRPLLHCSGLLTQGQPEQEQTTAGHCPMDDARHHREQAERCLELARHMSDPLAANLLHAAAARHLAQARDLEEQVRATGRSQRPRRTRRATRRFFRQLLLSGHANRDSWSTARSIGADGAAPGTTVERAESTRRSKQWRCGRERRRARRPTASPGGWQQH
jgi:hypothetical protein